MSDYVDTIIDNAATITTSSASADVVRPRDDGSSATKNVVFLVALGAAPTGTTPTLTYALQSSLDEVTWYTVASTAALNTNGQTARIEAKCVEPFWRVNRTVGGTTPSFTLVTSRLVFS